MLRCSWVVVTCLAAGAAPPVDEEMGRRVLALVEASAANLGSLPTAGSVTFTRRHRWPGRGGPGRFDVLTVRVDFDGPERLARYRQRRSEDGGPYGEPVAWRSLTDGARELLDWPDPAGPAPGRRLTLQEDLGGDADPLTAAIGLGPDEWPAAEIAEDLADAGGPGRRWRLVAAAEGGRLDGVPVVFAAFRRPGRRLACWLDPARGALPLRFVDAREHPAGAVTTQVHGFGDIRRVGGRSWLPFRLRIAPLDGRSILAAATIDAAGLGRRPAPGALRLDFDAPVRVLSEIAGVPDLAARRSWDLGALADARAARPFEAAGPAGRLVDRSMPLGLLLLVGLAVRSALHHRPTAGRPGADPS